MNKMEYQKPWAEFVQFENEDVVTANSKQPCDSFGYLVCLGGPGGTGGSNCPGGNGGGGCEGFLWTSRSVNTLNDDASQYADAGKFDGRETFGRADDIEGWG